MYWLCEQRAFSAQVDIKIFSIIPNNANGEGAFYDLGRLLNLSIMRIQRFEVQQKARIAADIPDLKHALKHVPNGRSSHYKNAMKYET